MSKVPLLHSPEHLRLSIAGLALITLISLGLPKPVRAQAGEGWISVLTPREWSGEIQRGLAVVRRNSIRVEGLAYQPGGIDRVMIDGRSAQLERRAGGEVRFVGYADTDTLPRLVEIGAYATGVGAPVIREYSYLPTPEAPEAASPDEAWLRDFTGERYAVVIGISDYRDPSIGSLPSLPTYVRHGARKELE